uniref:uncharacterized protein At5g39865 n=1 Tax=Erigeron canadensis TaxID=72917 RepID=UPI001CB9A2E3|nr:uncharacterized protein At5g39865 [Erigeron canadensis]
MIGSNNEQKSSIYNRSYTIHSTSTDYPTKPFFNNSSSFQRSDSFKRDSSSFDSIKGKVKNLCSIFEARRGRPAKPSSNPLISKTVSKSDTRADSSSSLVRLPGTEDRVVVYFTSLRGIRRTFEDCYSVRMILKFFKVFIDERDISMDSNYRKELLSVLGDHGKNKNIVSLPQVFIKGNYVGGADVIKQLHETGQLARLINGLPVRSTNVWQVCDGCGDVRFVPCDNCSGSKKVFDEDEDVLKRCPDCNENGLIRCPTCCS